MAMLSRDFCPSVQPGTLWNVEKRPEEQTVSKVDSPVNLFPRGWGGGGGGVGVGGEISIILSLSRYLTHFLY